MYTKPITELLKVEISNKILKGSITKIPIRIQDVSVEEFKNGFTTEEGFKEINFD